MFVRSRYLFLGLIGFLCLGLGLLPSLSQAQETETDSAFSFEALGNLTYQNAYVESGEVSLVDGVFEGTGSGVLTGTLRVALTGYTAYGDVTGDEVEDAVAVLVTDAGDAGVFFDLAVVLDEGGVLTNAAIIDLGDQVNISHVEIADGQIVVEMVIHGADDLLCCPTQPVRRIYSLGENGLILEAEEWEESENTAKFAPESDPTVALLHMGREEQYWLDPMMVSVHTGAMLEPVIEASTLGVGCAGVIDASPEVVLQWTENEDVAVLRLFLLSLGDPTLVVVTPGGEILCNDDYNPLVLDPYLEIENPAGGRYAIYAGSFDGNVNTPGFLVLTTQELSPATMDLAQLFPRQIVPDAVADPLPLAVLALDAAPAVTPTLTFTDTPFVQDLTVGGELGAYNIELGNHLCTGFIAAAPDFVFDWEGEAEKLAIFFEGAGDTTLVVRDPNGTFQCNDDADGAKNLNPYLDLTPMTGTYAVWVGSFAPDATVDGSLTVAGTPDMRPTPLTPDMIGE